MVNVATNANQANVIFFSKLKARLKRPCFSEFKPLFKKSIIEFASINLRLHSLHAANESWEGLNLLGWVMDEASAFTTLNGKDNALNVYSTLRSSANSRFPSMHWLGLIISFPRRQEGDFTLTKYAQCKDNPKMFGDLAYTWEVNPQYDPGHPLFRDFPWVTVEELNIQVPEPFADDFAFDALDARTKYMCEPPPQEGGFFELPHKVSDAVNPELPMMVHTKGVRDIEVKTWNARLNEFEMQQKKFVQLELEQLTPKRADCVYYMHGDPGLVSDFFAVCVLHTTPEFKVVPDADGRERQLKQVVVDCVLTWEPKANTPVDMANVNETILKLARYYDIRAVTFDKWNSAGSIQMLQGVGIHAEDLSFSASQQFAMYRNLKLLFYNDMIQLPAETEGLVKELQFLKVENNRITHDIYGKDRADALAAAAWTATGRQLSAIGQLVQETIGDRYNETQGPSHSVVHFKW